MYMNTFLTDEFAERYLFQTVRELRDVFRHKLVRLPRMRREPAPVLHAERLAALHPTLEDLDAVSQRKTRVAVRTAPDVEF